MKQINNVLAREGYTVKLIDIIILPDDGGRYSRYSTRTNSYVMKYLISDFFTGNRLVRGYSIEIYNLNVDVDDGTTSPTYSLRTILSV